MDDDGVFFQKQELCPYTHIVFSNPLEESTHRLIPLHAFTGCDTRCFICGHSKKLPLKFFETSGTAQWLG